MAAPSLTDSQGRLIASPTDTNQDSGSGGFMNTAGRLAGALTSGHKFLSAVTGGRLNTDALPGYLSKPLDIAASPIGLAAAAAAPFTGGASLGLAGAATRIGVTAGLGVAGGLVGGEVAQQTANHIPDSWPGVLKVGLPIATGIASGGFTGAAIGRRLPAALMSMAGNDLEVATRVSTRYGSAASVSSDPRLILEEAIPGVPKTEQIKNFVKGLVNKGVLYNEDTSPIVDQARNLSRVVSDEKNVAMREVQVFMARPDIKYGPIDGGKAMQIKAGDKWVSLHDAAADPVGYGLTPEQTEAVRQESYVGAKWAQLYKAVTKEGIESRQGLQEGGVRLPGGTPLDKNGKPLDTAKMLSYNTVTDSLADGVVHPPLDKAIGQYIDQIGNSVVGHHAANQLMGLRDKFGVAVFDSESAAMGEVKSQLGGNSPLNTIAKATDIVNDPLRSLHTMVDFAFNARLGPTAFVMHPVDYAKSLYKGFSSFFDDTVAGKEFKQIALDGAAAGHPEFNVANFARAGVRFSNPDLNPGVVGKVPVVNRLQRIYGNALDIMRARMMQTEMMNKANAGINTADPLIARQIANGINVTTGASIGKPVDGASAFVQFPNWLQSQIEFIAHSASDGSMTGAYARQAMMRMMGIGMTGTVVGNKLAGYSVDPREMFVNGVPIMKIGNQKIDLFGPYGSLIQGAVAAIEGDPTALVRGKASPLIQMGWDLMSGKTFSGDKASFDDPSYWARIVEPYGISSFSDKGPTTAVLDSFGVKATEMTPYQKLQDSVMNKYGKEYVDLTGKEKQQFQQSDPDLFKILDEKTKASAEAGDPKAKGILATQAANTDLTKVQSDLNTMLHSGQIDPVVFRNLIEAKNHDAVIQKQQIRKDYNLDQSTKEPTAVQAALSKYYALYDQADEGVLAGLGKTGQINWDVFDGLNKELRATLGPNELKALDDKVTTHDPSVQWYYDNKNVITQSGYFNQDQVAFDKFKASSSRIAPSVKSFTDLIQARDTAQAKGDKGTFVATVSMLNKIQDQAVVLKRGMRLKDKALQLALQQNGYLKQGKTQPMFAYNDNNSQVSA